MKPLILFSIALVFFAGIEPANGAEKRAVKIIDTAAVPREATPIETYHALIIGNNQYKHLPRLKTARNDAVEVEKLLREKLRFKTDILLDATRTDILGRINQMRKRLGEKDSLLIYYAGHGEYDKTVDKAYWLPVDAQRDDPTNWIIADDITSNIKRIAARHVLIVSDSCYSGTLGRQAVTDLSATGGRDGYLKKMQERPSRTLMASGGNEPVSDSGGGNNSVFAAAFLKALRENDQASFTAEEIFHSRIKSIVAGKSDQVPEYSNIKNSGDEGGDFVFRLASIGGELSKTAPDPGGLRREEDKQVEEARKKIEEKAGQRQQSPNLVGNGGFESGLATPWGSGLYSEGRSIWWTSGGCNCTAEADQAVRKSGNISLRITNRSPRGSHIYGTTAQRIPIVPKRSYSITLWAKASGLASNGAVFFTVDRDWKVRPIVLPEGNYDWQKFIGTFSLPGNYADLRIVSEDRGLVWIDDVQVVPLEGTSSSP